MYFFLQIHGILYILSISSKININYCIQLYQQVSSAEIQEYCTEFEKNIGGFIKPKKMLSDREAVKFGLKNEEDEVEKFIAANTQELAKDKWLCPLSGKKFKVGLLFTIYTVIPCIVV